MKAIVQKIVNQGKHGPYAVVLCNGISGSVTFSLTNNVWKEEEKPVEGSVVFIENIQAKRAGWRALSARFFKLTDNEIAKSKDGIDFIYPSGSQFPFDFIASRIVIELEKRNWNVPGIKVEFDVAGSGAGKYRRVSYISGDDFRLYFGIYTQRSMEGRIQRTSLSHVIIPRLDLHVFEDESGPSLSVYVGKDWEKDKKKFLNGCKVHSMMDKQPRTYLKYTGGFKKPDESGYQYTYQNMRAPYLVHDNDCGREYSPEGNEPKFFYTQNIFRKVTNWLEHNLLKKIIETPIASPIKDIFEMPAVIPFPKTKLHYFTFGSDDDARRIIFGKTARHKLEKSDHFALGINIRLVELGIRNDGTFADIAHDGFRWVGISLRELKKEEPIKNYEIPGYGTWSRDAFVIKINFNRANDVYVVDYGKGHEYINTIRRENPKQDILTNGQYNEFKKIIARTLVPISEYNFSFIKPVIVVHRELDFDEVEIFSGPHHLL